MSKIFINNDKLEAHRTTEMFFNMPIGGYCGLLLKKNVASKVAMLQKQFLLDVKELLSKNIDNVEVSNWALDYSDGYQRKLSYIAEDEMNEKSKFNRIKLLDNSELFRPNIVNDLFIFADDEEAKSCVMKEAGE